MIEQGMITRWLGSKLNKPSFSPLVDGASDAFNMSGLNASLTDTSSTKAPPQKSKSPAAFLGENSNLVNLDNLVSAKQLPAGLGKQALGLG